MNGITVTCDLKHFIQLNTTAKFGVLLLCCWIEVEQPVTDQWKHACWVYSILLTSLPQLLLRAITHATIARETNHNSTASAVYRKIILSPASRAYGLHDLTRLYCTITMQNKNNCYKKTSDAYNDKMSLVCIYIYIYYIDQCSMLHVQHMVSIALS